MPIIAGIATAVPAHRLDRATARRFAAEHFGSRLAGIELLLKVFDNSSIDHRYFCQPLAWYGQSHSIEEKNSAYIKNAVDLSAQAARKLFTQTSVDPSEIDYIIYVNTTGLATPSIDARLINVLGLRSNTRRTPIWGLGCAGGVAGLAHAYHHALGHPDERILLLATELCGLTFVADDFSRSNFVASALFGEGSAAVLVTGDDIDSDGPSILASKSTFYPDSLNVMGWHVATKGLQVVFAKRIPDIVAEHAREDLGGFLNEQRLTLESVSAFLFHPGGAKVLDAYRKALPEAAGKLEIAESVLRDYGNMSSVTVLYVLERYFGKLREKSESALLSALGPGFCSESLLIRG